MQHQVSCLTTFVPETQCQPFVCTDSRNRKSKNHPSTSSPDGRGAAHDHPRRSVKGRMILSQQCHPNFPHRRIDRQAMPDDPSILKRKERAAQIRGVQILPLQQFGACSLADNLCVTPEGTYPQIPQVTVPSHPDYYAKDARHKTRRADTKAYEIDNNTSWVRVNMINIHH